MRIAVAVLLLTLALRLTYSLAGFAISPSLQLDPDLIHQNQLTGDLTDHSEEARYGLLGVWERFDTLWYMRIAEHGYDMDAATIFYPLYPMLIAALTSLGLSALASALTVSTIASFFLFLGFARLAKLDLPAEAVPRAVVLLAVWPVSFIFFAGYPDSLVLALVVWAVWFARNEHWAAAGAAGLFAGLTKATGVLALIPLVILAWRRRRLRGAWVLAAAAGPAGYALFLYYSGLPSPNQVYLRYWATQVVLPSTTLIHALQLVAQGNVPVILNLGMLMVIGTLGLIRRPGYYQLYTAAALLLFLTMSTEPPLQSSTRYALAVFPAFLNLGGALRTRYWTVIALALFCLNLVLLAGFFEWFLIV